MAPTDALDDFSVCTTRGSQPLQHAECHLLVDQIVLRRQDAQRLFSRTSVRRRHRLCAVLRTPIGQMVKRLGLPSGFGHEVHQRLPGNLYAQKKKPLRSIRTAGAASPINPRS